MIKIVIDGVDMGNYKTECIDTAIDKAVKKLYDKRHAFNERMDGLYSSPDRDYIRYGQIGRGSMKTGTIRIDITDENGYHV